MGMYTLLVKRSPPPAVQRRLAGRLGPWPDMVLTLTKQPLISACVTPPPRRRVLKPLLSIHGTFHVLSSSVHCIINWFCCTWSMTSLLPSTGQPPVPCRNAARVGCRASITYRVAQLIGISISSIATHLL